MLANIFNLKDFEDRGLALHQQGRLDRALVLYRKILKVNPRDFNALHLSAVAYIRLDKKQEAIPFLERAVEVIPSHSEAWFHRGICYEAVGHSCKALDSYNRAISCNANHVAAHFHAGLVLGKNGDLAESRKYFGKVIELDPSNFTAYANLGATHEKSGQYELAAESFYKAIELNPGYWGAYLGLGIALMGLKQFDNALNALNKAAEINPDDANIHFTKGIALFGLQQINASLNSYDRAIALDPQFIAPRWNRSILLLKMGRYLEGWSDHELRIQTLPSEKAKFVPRWRGPEPLSGKSILLYSELGFGDTIHFCRYAKVLRDVGANVILEVQPEVRDILRGLDGPSQVIVRGESLPSLDFQIPLLSLPCALQTTLETIPRDIPYLFASDEKVRYWKGRLTKEPKLKVGLVWSGGEKEGWAVDYYSHRNIPLRALSLLAQANIVFYSLQKGSLAVQELRGLDDISWHSGRPIDLTDDLHNFSDTAALIQNLDLVISVDTAVAHLAGALGKPIWILNRFDGDWRWLFNREDSPWYPTAKLYSQKTSGDWSGVIERVRVDLDALARLSL